MHILVLFALKNKKARDVLMNAPSVVTKEQLDDVHIEIKRDENN